MKCDLQSMLKKTVKEYGIKENIISTSELEKKWNRSTAFAELSISNGSNLHTRSALMGLGTILEEDLSKNMYVSTIKVSHTEALLITETTQNKVFVAACAHEGLIFQKLARKSIELFAGRLGIKEVKFI